MACVSQRFWRRLVDREWMLQLYDTCCLPSDCVLAHDADDATTGTVVVSVPAKSVSRIPPLMSESLLSVERPPVSAMNK